jgi:acyl phosphate:glycerol-3-phosphate acyltransferase
MELILKIATSYLLGSILGSLLIGRLTGRGDLRTVGSRNPGSTNALRAYGKVFALGVATIDVGKGWVATRIVPMLALPLAPASSEVRAWIPAACGAAVMLGHAYPVWFGFRGGKAVATFIGAVIGLAPRIALPVLLGWVLVIVLTGFVGLASMTAAVLLPLLLEWTGRASDHPLVSFAIVAAVLVIFKHRGNITRMLAGCEPRARRLWLFGRHTASER